jgi:hypothetical protein
MAGPFNESDYELFVKTESSYGDAAATPSAGDAVRTRTRFPFKREKARLYRDQDMDGTSSVASVAGGREHGTWEIPAALTPSGVSATPTAPDLGEVFKAWFGVEDVGVGHSTLTTGSTTTVLQGTAGAVAALGLVVGDFVGVQAPAATPTLGVEVRQVTSITTDAITVDRALTSAPLTGRALYGCVTYKLSRSVINSLALFSYLNGDNAEEKLTGAICSDMKIDYDAGSDTPELTLTFSGMGKKVEPFTHTKPTGTFAGENLIPPAVYAYFGTDKHCILNFSLNANNALDLRNNESCTLNPSGTKRTGNNGKYNVEFDVAMMLTTGTVEGYYDAADDLTKYDVLVQCGTELGKGFAFRLPAYCPDADRGIEDGEVSLELSGRALGTGVADTEITCCFF